MSTRRSFFGHVFGGLALALGFRAAKPLMFHPDAFSIMDSRSYEEFVRDVGYVRTPSRRRTWGGRTLHPGSGHAQENPSMFYVGPKA